MQSIWLGNYLRSWCSTWSIRLSFRVHVVRRFIFGRKTT